MSSTLVLITGRTCVDVRFRIPVCSGTGNPGPRPCTQACQPVLRTRTTMERRTQSVQLHQLSEYLPHVTFAIWRTSTCRSRHSVRPLLRVSAKTGLWTQKICRSQQVMSGRKQCAKIWHDHIFPRDRLICLIVLSILDPLRAKQSIRVSLSDCGSKWHHTKTRK